MNNSSLENSTKPSENSPPAIVVTSVDSSTANGAYSVASVIQIDVLFSDVVTVTGSPRIQLETGATDQYATYTAGSNSSVLSFTYVVQAGDISIDLDYISTSALELNGGSIQAAQPVVLTLPVVGGLNSVAGKKGIVVDTIAPSPITSLGLYSDSTAGIHASVSTSPDLIIDTAPADVGTGVKDFQYRLIRTSDSAVIVDWTIFGTGVATTTRFSSLSLVNTESYKFSVRVRDIADNVSTTVDSNPFTIQTASTPYQGLGLADPTSLGDLSLSSTNVDGATYTRANPRQGKTMTVTGNVGWSNRSALFLRADVLSLTAGAEISASGVAGTDGSVGTGGTGGAGGSGGGGGAGSNGSNANGGAGGSGGNGINGSTVSGVAGPAGAGTASVYNVGFTYGSGGAGGAGENSGGTAGLGGAGLNGAGGGGGGGATGTMYGAGANNSGGGGGGGGVIWIATKSYSGGLTANVAGGTGANTGSSGTAKIFKIETDGSLTQKLFSDSW